MPKRKRPALPDPPELAARYGEMEARESRSIPIPTASIEVHLEEDEPPPPPAKPVPAVVIEDEDGETPSRPISDADEPALIHDTEAMPAMIHDAGAGAGADENDDDGSESHPILLDKPRREWKPDHVVEHRHALLVRAAHELGRVAVDR